MQQRAIKIGIITAMIAIVVMTVSVSTPSVSQVPATCQEQDVLTTQTALQHVADLASVVTYLVSHLHRMHCATQQIMAETTLERRLLYEEARRGGARAIEDVVTQLQLNATDAEQPPIRAFARAFRAYRTLNATIASEALLAETSGALAAVQMRADGEGRAAFEQARNLAAFEQAYAALRPTYQGLQSDAFMTTWLVLGPIPVTQDEHRPHGETQREAFRTDYLTAHGGESGIAPKVGMVHTIGDSKVSQRWKFVQAEGDSVNLSAIYGGGEFVIAYAWAEIDAPEAQTVLLGIGSNDAVKVWLNGELIHKNWVFRSVHKDDDIVPVTLHKGMNRILFKVQNGTYMWGFSCRVLGPDALREKFVRTAGKGDVGTLQRLLSHGAEINTPNQSGLTPLRAARIRGRADAVKLLLARGADQHTAMPPKAQLVDALFHEAIAEKSPGAAILVAQHGDILYQKGFGQASLEHGVPITPLTKFRIGSITKQFTAAAILTLQKAGALRVTDELSRFLPDYPRGDEVTIHHLLTHTSGIHSYTKKPNFKKRVKYSIEPEDLIDSFKDDPYDFDPGEHWIYNNSGYFLLGYIVGKVAGQSFADYLQHQFFVPLGMTNTGVYHRDLALEHEASGYSYKYKRGTFHQARNWDMSHAGGAGALYATVVDLFRWNEAIWGGKALDQASLKAAFEPVTLNNGRRPRGVTYGYGWGMGTHRGLQVIAHNGGLDGFASRLARYPDQQFTVTVLSNARPSSPGLNVNRLANAVAEIYLWPQMKTFDTTDTTVDASVYDAYVGQYAYATLTVKRQDDRVFAQLTGQPQFEIFPKSATTFVWKVVDAEVTFVKDENGVVTHATHRQRGRTFTAPRLKGTVLPSNIVGQYAYKILRVTRAGDRLFAQLTGQNTYEIFPKSETTFFWKVAEAQVTFVKNEHGLVTHAIHRQRGEFEAPKIK